MSRIGRAPIPVPSGVKIDIADSRVTVQGPKGTLSQTVHPDIKVELTDSTLHVTRPDDARTHRALHGLYRTLIANMVEGVTKGYQKTLEISGVGYRASKSGDNLILQVGYSHPVELTPPPSIAFNVEGNNRIHVLGIDKQLVGEVAARVRAIREPEPYKGKGIKYQGEVIRRKAGKAGRTGAKKK